MSNPALGLVNFQQLNDITQNSGSCPCLKLLCTPQLSACSPQDYEMVTTSLDNISSISEQIIFSLWFRDKQMAKSEPKIAQWEKWNRGKHPTPTTCTRTLTYTHTRARAHNLDGYSHEGCQQPFQNYVVSAYLRMTQPFKGEKNQTKRQDGTGYECPIEPTHARGLFSYMGQ